MKYKLKITPGDIRRIKKYAGDFNTIFPNEGDLSKDQDKETYLRKIRERNLYIVPWQIHESLL